LLLLALPPFTLAMGDHSSLFILLGGSTGLAGNQKHLDPVFDSPGQVSLPSQGSRPLGIFRLKKVAPSAFLVGDLPCPRCAKTLLGPRMGLHFGHLFNSLLGFAKTPESGYSLSSPFPAGFWDSSLETGFLVEARGATIILM